MVWDKIVQFSSKFSWSFDKIGMFSAIFVFSPVRYNNAFQLMSPRLVSVSTNQSWAYSSQWFLFSKLSKISLNNDFQVASRLVSLSTNQNWAYSSQLLSKISILGRVTNGTDSEFLSICQLATSLVYNEFMGEGSHAWRTECLRNFNQSKLLSVLIG